MRAPSIDNICVIDDNPADLKIISSILKKAFPKAFLLLSETKDDLLERITWVRPDIIICDYRLRECTGLDILIEIKKTVDVPFIFCTSALNTQNEFSESILNGASGYVLKDNMERLPETVMRVLQHNQNKINKEKNRVSKLSIISYKLQKLNEQIKETNPDRDIIQAINEIHKDVEDVKNI